MRSKLLVPTAAAVLLAGTVMAGAQATHEGGKMAQGAGQAQKERSEGSPSTQGKSGQSVQQEKNGAQQKGSAQEKSGAQQKQNSAQQEKSGAQKQNSAQQEKSGRGQIQTQGQGTREQNSREEHGAQQHNDRDNRGAQQKNERENRGAQRNERDRTQGQGQREQNAQPAQRNERNEGNRQQTETNRSSGGTSVTLTTEQRTKIRETVLRGSNAPRVSKVDFDVKVGTAVPRSVHVVAVPQTIVEIHPDWRGFMYFVYNDEIVIVEPGSLKIIAVLEV